MKTLYYVFDEDDMVGRQMAASPARACELWWNKNKDNIIAPASWKSLTAYSINDLPNINEFEPEDDADAWKAQDDATVAAHKAKQLTT
jgi:hypothetical protein